MTKLLIFDLDGTLVDSRRDIADAANELLVECGAAPLPELTIGRMVGDGAATLVARAFGAAGLTLVDDALPRFLKCYERRLVAHTRPYADMPAVLASLKRNYTLGVLTNKPLDPTRRILDALDLTQYFAAELVLGGDGPHARKPDPAGLLTLVARAQSVPVDTCLVGDSIIDWQTAHSAGARACVARYGFGFAGFPAERLTAVDLAIDAPAELLTIL